MHFTTATVLAAASFVLASPFEAASQPITLPLRQIHNIKSAKDLVTRGEARLGFINNQQSTSADAGVGSAPAVNELVSYVARVDVGGQSYDIIVDTGSSNTWVGAGRRYLPGRSSHDTGNNIFVGYGSGYFSGEEYTDAVSFAGFTVEDQSIGAASEAFGFAGVDGIFGLGPVALTRFTVANTTSVPTFLDNLRKQGTITSEVLGVSFRPASGSSDADPNGELTIGGVDRSKFKGDIGYFPSPGPYWGVKVSSFQYGGKDLGAGSGIVDTGTTLIYLPSAVFKQLEKLADGDGNDASGLLALNFKPTSNFVVQINGKRYTLTPAQYLVPLAQYKNLELDETKYYAWFAEGGSGSINTIIGQKFLENYYSVYDTDNGRVGFAPNA